MGGLGMSHKCHRLRVSKLVVGATKLLPLVKEALRDLALGLYALSRFFSKAHNSYHTCLRVGSAARTRLGRLKNQFERSIPVDAGGFRRCCSLFLMD